MESFNQIQKNQRENQLDKLRKNFEKEHSLRAKYRNKYRTIWQKIFGKEKTTTMDIAMEEALAMNEAIEKVVKEDKKTYQEALEIVSQYPEFQLKGKERIKREEYVRAKILQIGKFLLENNFQKAFSILSNEKSKKGIDREVLEIIDSFIVPLIKNHISELIKKKNWKNFVKLIHYFASYIKKEDLRLEVPKPSKIRGEIIQHIVSCFCNSDYELKNFETELEKFNNLGLLEKDEIIKLPEIKRYAKEIAFKYFENYCNNEKELIIFQKYRDALNRLKIMTIDEINNIPEIRKLASEKHKEIP
jgi:hypothetical protein